MNCPECGTECGRDEVDVGVGTMYGPYGCVCGWSESPEYSHTTLTGVDSRGGLTLGSIYAALAEMNAHLSGDADDDECEYGCHHRWPYGFVIMRGCPVHNFAASEANT